MSDPTGRFINGLAFCNALRYNNGEKAVLLAYPGEGHHLRARRQAAANAPVENAFAQPPTGLNRGRDRTCNR